MASAEINHPGLSATDSPLSFEIRLRLRQLQALAAGWDGSGSCAIQTWALDEVEAALRELNSSCSDFREPFVAPKADGLLQLDWGGDEWRLEMELLPDGWSIVGERLERAEPEYFTAEVERPALSRLPAYYYWWHEQQSDWPAPI